MRLNVETYIWIKIYARAAGVDVFSGEVNDMTELDVYEPLVVKEQIITSASEAAVMILRIDDVIAAGKSGMPSPPPGGAGGMGGPGDMDFD